jgi:hypothetical protein
MQELNMVEVDEVSGGIIFLFIIRALLKDKHSNSSSSDICDYYSNMPAGVQ